MRKQILVVMASFMMMSSAFPTYAATASTTQNESSDGINWIIPREGYKTWEHDGQVWEISEADAQVKRWAEDNKGAIPTIVDEKARYEAIVTKVCDFLTYDDTYEKPHVAYTLRDGKGVCADYTALTKALCDICGIQAKVSVGTMYGLNHDMLRVTINGHEYYSDPTGYDSGAYSMLMDSAPAEYEDRGTIEGNGSDLTGVDTEGTDYVNEIEANKRGESIIGRANGVTYYGSIEDAIAVGKAIDEGDDATLFAIWDKYGVPYVK